MNRLSARTRKFWQSTSSPETYSTKTKDMYGKNMSLHLSKRRDESTGQTLPQLIGNSSHSRFRTEY